MRRILALIVALAILLFVLWLALGRETPASAPQGAPQAPAVKPDAAPSAELESTSAVDDAGRTETAVPSERANAASPESPAPKLAELRGRFVLEGGAPAVGTKIQLDGGAGNNERVMKYGKPKEEWKALTADCDADGRFSLRFDPPRAYQFFLKASYPGCVTANWRWGEIEPASTKDLGETVLPRGGAVAGRVLDSKGKSTHDSWQVYADAMSISKGDGSDASRAYAPADKETGQFRIEGLPPGEIELKAHSELANWIEGPKVQVRAGETTEADIQYTGPDNSRRITVVTFAQPFHIFASDVNEILLSAPGMEPRKAQKIARSSQSFSFDDLEPGSYSITIDDPKFKPWRQDDVQPGQQVKARLQGASSVSLSVLDAATRAPLARYGLRARFDKSDRSPNQFQIFNADKEPPVGGLVEGLIPTEQTLIVVAEGYAPCELKLEGLTAGEVRPLTAEMRKGATLVARVLQADGKTPIAGSKVTLDPSPTEGKDPPGGVIFLKPPGQREAQSDAQGRASFPATPAGKYDLRCEIAPMLAAQVKSLEIAASDTEKSVDLLLPPNGWLVGRVLGFEEAPVEGCSLVVMPLSLSVEERALAMGTIYFARSGVLNPVGPDGSFRAGPGLAGRAKVSLQYPMITRHDGPNSRSSSPGATIEFGEIEIPAGGEKHQDFDLRGKLPGRVEAQITVNGAPVPDVLVLVSKHHGQDTIIALDEQGHGTSAPIPPGPVFFSVQTKSSTWSWTPPGNWTVAHNQTLRVQWDVALATGTLQIVDETSGQPLVECEVSIRADAEAEVLARWVARTSDEQGKIELHLVPAAYRLHVQGQAGPDGKYVESPYPPALFEWTASGPAQPVLKLSKKP